MTLRLTCFACLVYVATVHAQLRPPTGVLGRPDDELKKCLPFLYNKHGASPKNDALFTKRKSIDEYFDTMEVSIEKMWRSKEFQCGHTEVARSSSEVATVEETKGQQVKEVEEERVKESEGGEEQGHDNCECRAGSGHGGVCKDHGDGSKPWCYTSGTEASAACGTHKGSNGIWKYCEVEEVKEAEEERVKDHAMSGKPPVTAWNVPSVFHKKTTHNRRLLSTGSMQGLEKCECRGGSGYGSVCKDHGDGSKPWCFTSGTEASAACGTHKGMLGIWKYCDVSSDVDDCECRGGSGHGVCKDHGDGFTPWCLTSGTEASAACGTHKGFHGIWKYCDVSSDEIKELQSKVVTLEKEVLVLTAREAVPGPAGKNGQPGPRGEQGFPGRDGARGIIGPKGNRGDMGLPGERGPKGERGEDGLGLTLKTFELGQSYNVGDYVFAKASAGDHNSLFIAEKSFTASKAASLDIGNWEEFRAPKGDTGEKGAPGVAGIPGERGPRGQDGYRGATGSRGVPGAMGAQGTAGERGLPGATGARGVRGNPGDRGIPGRVGARGVQGIVGERGAKGATGAQGVAGERGHVGPQGVQGIIGKRGLPGPKGATGAQGVAGEHGHAGATGVQGIIGNRGFPGPKGATGTQGVTGKRGLQGDRGFPGLPGERGAQGEKGNDGLGLTLKTFVRGQTYRAGDYVFAKASTGDHDSMFIATKSLTASKPPSLDLGNWEEFQAPRGRAGERGATGAQGVAGDRGLPGQNGGKGATGAQGEVGERGLPGAKGHTGSNGTGLTMRNFALGNQYVKGDYVVVTVNGHTAMYIGSSSFIARKSPQNDRANWIPFQAPRGERGPVGATGKNGKDGATGAVGERGLPGPKGATGDASPRSHSLALWKLIGEENQCVTHVENQIIPGIANIYDRKRLQYHLRWRRNVFAADACETVRTQCTKDSKMLNLGLQSRYQVVKDTYCKPKQGTALKTKCFDKEIQGHKQRLDCLASEYCQSIRKTNHEEVDFS